MYGVRIHGRGGQGAKTAARIIARACFLEGKETQDFAIYGAERRGAPIMSFVRIDDKRILTRGYITHPDLVAVMDETLLNTVDVTQGLGKGVLFVNTSKKLKMKTNAKVYTAGLTDMAFRMIGADITDTALVGGIAKISGIARLESILKAIGIELAKLGEEKVKKNRELAKIAWEQTI